MENSYAKLDALNEKIHNNVNVLEEVTLKTCNRYEIYLITEEDINIPTTTFIVEKEDNAINHLLRLASGLESMIMGEDQILGQIKDARKKAIKARLKTYSVEDFQRLFDKAEGSTFLKGGNDRNWSATFDWLIKDTNMAKVLDGNYDNKSKPQQAIPARRNDKAQELDDFYKMVADWADGSGGDST
jgi:hypothetical protein